MKQTNTLIIGASISGLATAASLQKHGIEFIIVEKETQVGTPWRNHYERLHLHTNKRLSNLPYKNFGKLIPRYPSRQHVVDYLSDYQKVLNINPVFNTQAISVQKDGDYWITRTTNGIFKSKYVVMATGAFAKPKPVSFTGMETFSGQILHSCDYKTGKKFKSQKVLVVGFGNSACEIAVNLYEEGALPTMAVRSPVNIIPRDIFGIPILELSLLMSRLSPRVADAINAPLIKMMFGDINKLGLKKMPYGPLEQIYKDGKAPVLDIGTIKHIRNGQIKIYDDIDHIESQTIYFKDGRKDAFDVIIACIGYCRNYAEIVEVNKNRFEDLGVSVDKQKYFGKDDLYFCGYWISPTGQIREISLDAKKIAKDIWMKEKL